MESYWCEKKNSIVNWINYGDDFNPSLTPCLKSECDRWTYGEALLYPKSGIAENIPNQINIRKLCDI